MTKPNLTVQRVLFTTSGTGSLMAKKYSIVTR